MDLNGAVCVVTGAGSGIGSALVERLLATGAAGVVACDLNRDGVEALAAEAGEAVAPLVGDVTDPGLHAEAVALAEARWGSVDVYCSNAGVLSMGGLSMTVEDWQRHWEVNVLAHRHAAVAVLPSMLDRSRGWLLQTTSAAGHLMLLDAPAYTATKHAAVGLAEWLHATYRHRGIGVSCVCPLGVDTPLMRRALDGIGADVPEDVLSAHEVAAAAVQAVEDERFLVLPHAVVADHLRQRGGDIDGWVARMNEQQRRTEGAAS